MKPVQTRTIHCSGCSKFSNGRCEIEDNSPLYRCTVAAIDEFAGQLKKGDRVLEIGCGSWAYCRDRVLDAGGIWEGLDPLKTEKNLDVIATRRGSVHEIPFEDRSFDFVIGNQTIEHWHEFGVGFEKALGEIHRVLKPGGRFFLNAPIHLHGHRSFLLDEREKIEGLFDSRYWSDLLIEEWKNDPAQPYLGWKRCRFDSRVFPSLEGRGSFMINLVGTRSEGAEMPNGESITQKFKREGLVALRTFRSTRILAYHLHYGARHFFSKLGLLR